MPETTPPAERKRSKAVHLCGSFSRICACVHMRKYSSLSKEECERYRQMFNSIDEDRSGTLDFDEMVIAFKRLGTYTSQEDARVLFSLADADGSGTVDLPEFLALMRNVKNGACGAAAFKQLADTGEQVLSRLKSSGVPIDPDEALSAPLTDKAVGCAKEHLPMNEVREYAACLECTDKKCKFAFNVLTLDLDLIKLFLAVVSAKMISDLQATLASNFGVYDLSARVREEAVVLDALRWFVGIAHKYSHCTRLPSYIEHDKMMEVHSLRKAMCVVACQKSMEDVVDFAKQLVQQALVKEAVQRELVRRGASRRALARQGSSFSSSVGREFAKGAAREVGRTVGEEILGSQLVELGAIEAAVGVLGGACSIM